MPSFANENSLQIMKWITNLRRNPQQNSRLEKSIAFSPSNRIFGNTVWYLKENFSSEKKNFESPSKSLRAQICGEREGEQKGFSSSTWRHQYKFFFLFRAFNLIFMKFMCNIVLSTSPFLFYSSLLSLIYFVVLYLCVKCLAPFSVTNFFSD